MSSDKSQTRLKDIAKAAGVSQAAVGRVLLGTGKGRVRVGKATTAKIEKLAKEMNYVPNMSAKILRGQKSGIIGILIDSQAAMVKFEILKVIEDELRKHGYCLMLGQTHDNYDFLSRIVSNFMQYRFDGAICISHDYPAFQKKLESQITQMKNVVFLGQTIINDAVCVDIDIESAIYKAVKHLYKKNYSRVGLMLTSPLYPTMRTRLNGYKQAVKDFGLPDDLIWKSAEDSVNYNINISEIVDHLVVEKRADAIIASNDQNAARIMKEVKKRGLRVPEDVAIIGYDNIQIGELMDPELTTINPPKEELAKNVVNLLIAMIDGKELKDSEKQIFLDTDLVVRGST